MSIIHDALKKVQQGLGPKSTVTETASAYLYETPPKIEILPPMKNKIKSLFILSCATVITGASILYIYQQFQNDIPKVNGFAKKSFYKLIDKEGPPAFKTKAPEDLKALGQLTVNPPKPPIPSIATKPPAILNTADPIAFITLNIHGVMSDGPNNVVLINDQVYQEGDEVNGVKIIKISLNSITVINNGKEETIRVKN